MTSVERTAPFPNWAALPPPEAVLFLQFSPRRRAMSVLFACLGLALAAALVGYGATNQTMWPVVAASASAVGGFVLTWLYQRRERPLQIAEDRGRAGAMVHSFEGRLEIGSRLVFTHDGIDLGDETLSWNSIRLIEASLVGAMSKHATITLDGAGAGRRLSLSLAQLREQPSVVYAVMKMLWMRHRKPREVSAIPRPEPRPQLAFPRATSTLGTLWSALGGIALVAGFIASAPLLNSSLPWLAALPAGVGIALFFWAVSRANRADWRLVALEQERFDALQSAGDETHHDFVIRRKAARVWPTIITVAFAAPAAIFFAMGEVPQAAVFLMFGSVIALVAWLIAWWRGSGTIATLTSTGIVLRDEEIPWSDIASLELTFVPRVETRLLVIRLAKPRTAKTLGQRFNSTLSRGSSDREIVVSLARADEPPAVILELAESRWRRRIGEGRATEADAARLEVLHRETRTWSQFSSGEKRRSLIVGAAILAVLGLSLHGVRSSFQMSDRWFYVSLVASGVLTLAGTIALMRSGVFASIRNQHGTVSYLAFLILLCGMAWMVLWSAIGLSLPSLGTRSLGRASTADAHYDKQRFRESDFCPFPLGVYVESGSPFRFCASPRAYASLPADGRLRVGLRESWFGVQIVSVSTVGN